MLSHRVFCSGIVQKTVINIYSNELERRREREREGKKGEREKVREREGGGGRGRRTGKIKRIEIERECD